MEKKDLLMTLEIKRDYSERQVLQSIKTLRGILDRVEQAIKDDNVRADDGLQGNEWRLYKELSNLERLDEFIKELKNMS